MRVVIQRVRNASVTVDEETVGEIGDGLCILLGIRTEDTLQDIKWLCQKIVNLRIFGDSNGIMNHSVKELEKEVLVVSQFTLYANSKKGNRPSYARSANSEQAQPLYKAFLNLLEEELGRKIESGIFGADMKINLCNDGPVTLILDSQNKEL